MTDADGSALADTSACPLHVAVLGRGLVGLSVGRKPLATSESDRPRWRGLEGQPARAYRHRLGRAPDFGRSFAANAVRLHLHVLACNLGNFMRTLANARGSGAVVADKLAQETDQDRHEGHESVGTSGSGWPRSLGPAARVFGEC